VKEVARTLKFQFFTAAIAAIFVLTGCATAEPRPAGVSRFISFSVSPVYPKSFDITAAAEHSIYGHFSIEELKEAWRKKAIEVAKGRKFRISSLVVHDNEADYVGALPMKSRSVSGTITLLN
jgi:hypothetical protein